MKIQHIALLCLTGFWIPSPLFSKPIPIDEDRDEYEKSISAIVRNKHFYKTSSFEVGIDGGSMPYDSLINHYLVGGRITWHIADHYGWEIIHFQHSFPSVTNYIRNLVSANGLSNVQTVKINEIVSSNFLLSPFYGKIRFFGSQTLHFDIYLVGGLGTARTDTYRFSATGTNADVIETTLSSTWDPLIDIGLGINVFLNDAMGLQLDLRDYFITSTTYEKKSLKGNFTFSVGLSFFLPTF